MKSGAPARNRAALSPALRAPSHSPGRKGPGCIAVELRNEGSTTWLFHSHEPGSGTGFQPVRAEQAGGLCHYANIFVGPGVSRRPGRQECWRSAQRFMGRFPRTNTRLAPLNRLSSGNVVAQASSLFGPNRRPACRTTTETVAGTMAAEDGSPLLLPEGGARMGLPGMSRATGRFPKPRGGLEPEFLPLMARFSSALTCGRGRFIVDGGASIPNIRARFSI
jgi:hypothetical protein